MGKELDVRWYDEVLDKFWYPIDDIESNKKDGYVFSLGVDFDTLELVGNVYTVDEEDRYVKHRRLTKKDYYTGFNIDDEKIYTNDILYRQLRIEFYGVDEKGTDYHDWAVPEYNTEYGGFYVGERELAFEIGKTYDNGFKCTKYKKAGNIHQHSHLFTSWGENGGKVDNEQ